MKINVTKEADSNIRSIVIYIAKDSGSKDIAKQVLNRIEVVISHIAEMPNMGHSGRKKNTEEFSIPGLPYIIVYQVGKDYINILAVVHGARER